MHFSTLSLGILALLAPVYARPDDPSHPELIGKSEGVDSGNTLCSGACVSDPGTLSCQHAKFDAKYGCFMCCLSDDNLDNLDESFIPLDGLDGSGEK
ncbi:hypothetical protein BDW62DRAFT_183745 [Aspergillus aurantiobrunneus]